MGNDVLSIVIIVIALISFVLEKIPLAMTAALASIAMGVLGIMPLSDIYAGAASTTAMMVGGMMIIGNCLFETGAAKWLGQKLVKTPIASNERIMMFSITAIACVLSAFLSNSAVVATLIPTAGAMVARSNGKLQNKHVVMGIGMGAALGGCGTIVGSTSQLTSQNILEKTEGVRTMEFFELGYVVGPMCVIMCIYLATIGLDILKKSCTFDDVDPGLLMGGGANDSEDEAKLSWKAILSIVVLILCVIGFVQGWWNVGVIAITGASILIVANCMSFKKAFSTLDWNTLVILAAAQGFAQGLNVSGGGKLIAQGTIDLFGGENASVVMLMVAGIVVSCLLTNVMSNTALAAMMTPIYIQIGFTMGVDPISMVLAVNIGCSMALFTPIGTPALTQTLVAGYRFNDYVKVGLPITIVLMIVACILCPIIYGIHPLAV